MTIATAAVTATKSGTSWTIDVTAANLSPDLLVKDFVVLNNTSESILSNSNFAKTSQTVLTYSGPDVGTNTAVEVRRQTPVSRFQDILFASLFRSDVYNTEIDNILKVLYEMSLFGGQSTAGAFDSAPLDEPFSISWSTDTIRSRTANRLYDKFTAVDSAVSANSTDISGLEDLNTLWVYASQSTQVTGYSGVASKLTLGTTDSGGVNTVASSTVTINQAGKYNVVVGAECVPPDPLNGEVTYSAELYIRVNGVNRLVDQWLPGDVGAESSVDKLGLSGVAALDLSVGNTLEVYGSRLGVANDWTWENLSFSLTPI